MMNYAVVGGGIAGICCVEELCRLCPRDTVTLISASTVLKGVDHVARLTKIIEEFQVVERDLSSMAYPNLRFVQGVVTSIDTDAKALQLASGEVVPYECVCVCTGARPKVLADHPRVLTIRDTESIQDFAARLPACRRVVVVGNGGIALELVDALRRVEVVWVIKHGHIGDAFFDVDAAQFLLQEMRQRHGEDGASTAARSRHEEQEPKACSGNGSSAASAARQAPRQPTTEPQLDSAGPHSTAASSAPHQGLDSTSGPGPGAEPSRATETQPEAAGPHSTAQRDAPQQGLGSTSGPGPEAEPSRETEPQPEAAGPHSTAQCDAPQQGRSSTSGPGPGGEPAGSASTAQHAGASVPGHALGPRWTDTLGLLGAPPHVELECRASVERIEDGPEGSDWALRVHLSNGSCIEADLVVSAIGVAPNTEWLPAEVQRGEDGGVLVDRCFRSSMEGVYVAGDACSMQPEEMSPHWFPMRLWTQARQEGWYAAHCMVGMADMASDFCFELFTHVTRFLGKKVILIGLYNGQRLYHEPASDITMYTRSSEAPESTFVRVLLLRGRMQGAVLIGETDLEETFENLILNQLDVSGYGPELLDPDVELDHVFD